MGQRSRFFDDVGGDRIYTSDAWAQLFAAIQSDGYVSVTGSEFTVTESSPAAMSVRVSDGIAWIRGRYFEVYSGPETVAVPTADPTNPRIDRVVIRLDTAARTVELALLEGTPAASPSAPALTRDSSTWELSIAKIAVGAAVASIVNANITAEKNDDSVGGASTAIGGVPSGTLAPTARSTAPAGWLMCSGQAVSRSTYATLFAAIGTTYGAGDGSTTFAVPDMRGRFPLGKAAAGTGSALAATGGALDHTHTGPSHTHATDTIGSPDSTEMVNNQVAGTKVAVGSGTHGHIAGDQITDASGTGATGSANAPYQVVNYIIKI